MRYIISTNANPPEPGYCRYDFPTLVFNTRDVRLEDYRQYILAIAAGSHIHFRGGSSAFVVAVTSNNSLGNFTISEVSGSHTKGLQYDVEILEITAASGPSLVNSASNVNVGGVGVFKQNTAGNLEFRGINATDPKITVALDGANNEIDVAFGSVAINDLSNVNAAPVNGDVLTFNTGTGQWEALAPSGGLANPIVGQSENFVNWSTGGSILQYSNPWEVTNPDGLTIVRRFINNAVVGNGEFTLLTSVGPDVTTDDLTQPIIAIRVSKATWFGFATQAQIFIANGWCADPDRVMLLSNCTGTAASKYIGYTFSGGGATDEGTTFLWPISANTGSGTLVAGEQVNLATDQLDRNILTLLNNNVAKSPDIPDQLTYYDGSVLRGLHQVNGPWSVNGYTNTLNALVTPTVVGVYVPILASTFTSDPLLGWSLNSAGEVNRLVFRKTIDVAPYKAYELSCTTSLLCPAGLTRIISVDFVINGGPALNNAVQTTSCPGGSQVSISLRFQRQFAITDSVEVQVQNQTDGALLDFRHLNFTIVGIL